MAGTSETLLEARIISTAFDCLSSGSAGGGRSGTNRSSRFVCLSWVHGGWEEKGPWSRREKDAGAQVGAGTELITGDSGACLSWN